MLNFVSTSDANSKMTISERIQSRFIKIERLSPPPSPKKNSCVLHVIFLINKFKSLISTFPEIFMNSRLHFDYSLRKPTAKSIYIKYLTKKEDSQETGKDIKKRIDTDQDSKIVL